jgi:hypothetical protein
MRARNVSREKIAGHGIVSQGEECVTDSARILARYKNTKRMR